MLPRESRVLRALSPECEWGNGEYLLARVANELITHNWMYESAHSEKKVKRPKHIDPPGTTQKRETFTPEEIDEIFARAAQKKEKGAEDAV